MQSLWTPARQSLGGSADRSVWGSLEHDTWTEPCAQSLISEHRPHRQSLCRMQLVQWLPGSMPGAPQQGHGLELAADSEIFLRFLDPVLRGLCLQPSLVSAVLSLKPLCSASAHVTSPKWGGCNRPAQHFCPTPAQAPILLAPPIYVLDLWDRVGGQPLVHPPFPTQALCRWLRAARRLAQPPPCSLGLIQPLHLPVGNSRARY